MDNVINDSIIQGSLEYKFKTKPYKHQLDGWRRNKDLRWFAYFMEMGTGKTKLAIDTAAYLYDMGRIDALLVFANHGSYLNWITTEIPVHMPSHIRYAAEAWRSDANAEQTRNLNSFLKLNDISLKIFVMNIEALAFERSYKTAETFCRSHKTMIVVDESTTIKNPKAKRTKAILKLAPHSVARRIMTGNATPNNPLDVFSQMEFLKPGLLGFSSYYTFRAHFAELVQMRSGQRSFLKVTGFVNLDELRERISKHAIMIRKEDCLDLPPKVYETYQVNLSDEQKQHYDQLKKLSITMLENEKVVTTKLVLTRLLRLHQLTCGFLTDDDKAMHPVKNNRLDSLLELVDEIDGKVIIWATYRYNMRQIHATLSQVYGPDQVVAYYGDIELDERERAKHEIQSGKARFFVGNPQVGGYGLTLTAAHNVIYFSNNWNADIRGQSEDRVHRIGQSKTVTYVDLFSPGTVDEKILKALKDKKSLASEVMASNWRQYF